MSATLTTDISRFIIAGVDEIFRKNWDSYPIQHKNFTKYKKATRETMNYDQTGNLPTASVMEESAPFVFNKMTQGYSTAIKCTQIGAGIAFSLKARKFDLYDVIDESKVKELAHSLRDYEEVVATRPLNQAFTLNLADGKPLCAKDKPLVNHATLKNNTVTTGTFKGASGYENIKDGVKMFSQFKNHAGNPIVSCPDKFITHEVNMMDAEEIFNSSKKPFTSENTVNGLPGLKPYYSRWLLSESVWFLIDSRYDHIIWQEHTPMTLEWHENFSTKDLEATAYELAASGALPNIGIVGSTGI